MPAVTVSPPCSVLLLAGGRGQRMGGRDKGLLDWHGRPLIAWLHDLVRPLTDDLIISCNRNAERYAPFADRLVQDDDRDFQGPLAGIRAGLQVARHPQLLVLPCDAPCLDRALLEALLDKASTHPVMVRQDGYWEPLFCLLPTALGASLEQAWRAGERSPQRWLRELAPLAVDCPPGDPRLANLNTPALLG
ncbi:molybdenum cofactor guanylyltransferase MobA [Pseudomonas benzenivorans]|uniref:Molybdenum cofactor guanylyltransferase n=1 Tax=Pseudomonas benzenivorans TaxID=556533 RepID=A0ABZ0PS24_9PSED|nr:molybdenum cofactor guanylyltransferase MobA [Pseudomonas benzenivorans]WPC03696.1 molybdenum cofactor guanylyltransferase MobA [Pseudomonas benzenivorans]